MTDPNESGEHPAPVLEEMRRRAEAFAQYHAKHEGYGGVSRDFHAMALTFLREDVPDLVAEVERLRAEVERLRSVIAATRVFLEDAR